MQKPSGKVVFVAGGSTGLGLAIAKKEAARGAHVTIFGRRQTVLDEAREQVLKARASDTQEVNAVSVDLADASQVEAVFTAQAQIPDVLYCNAGGASAEVGFFADISATDIERCMRNNYLTSAYPAHTVIKLWKQNDQIPTASKCGSIQSKTRCLVFISSAAALAGLPGYDAYTPAKCAQRGLADTLRQELLMYNNPEFKYVVHCAFPNNFSSPAFIIEQRTKPELTRLMESTTGDIEDLMKRIPTAEDIAESIVPAIGKRDFAIFSDFETTLAWSNMVGPSPKRGWGIADSLMGLIAGFVAWPIVRRRWDKMCIDYGKSSKQKAANGMMS